MKRRQFLVKLCYAMTINKAQCQSINNLGVYLTQPILPRGQLFVALSRAGLLHRTKIMLTDTEETQETIQNNFGKYTTNVAFTEVLH